MLTDLGKNTLLKSSLSSLKAFFILTNGTSLDEHGLFFQALSVEGRPVWASASRIPSHVSAVCAQPCVRVSGCVCARAHSDRIALFRIFPPDCPNKPEQTGRRHCGDVTHSSEPWRLSAWRRSGGLHGDVKQESAHSGTPPFTCVARGSLRTNRLRSFCRSFITLKQRDEITAPRTCRAAAVSRSYKGVRTQTSCSIPWNDRHSLRYYFKKMHAFYYMCRNSGDHRVSENRYECIMH